MTFPTDWSPALCAAHEDLTKAMLAARKVMLDTCSSPLHEAATSAHATWSPIWRRFGKCSTTEAEAIEALRLVERAYLKAALDKTSLHAVARDRVVALRRDAVAVANVEPVGDMSLQLSAGVAVFIEPYLQDTFVAEGRKVTLVAFDARLYHDLVGERLGLPAYERGKSHLVVLDDETVTAWPMRSGTHLSLVGSASP
jgi:hypothetical protein